MGTGTKKLRVLIVEDCLLTVEQLAEVVDSGVTDLTMSTAASEEAAITAVRALNPHLIVLDLNLRKGSGFHVLRAVKALPNPPTVVVLTNFGLPRYRELAILMGADYFLDKARDTESLSSIVGMVAQRHGMETRKIIAGHPTKANDRTKLHQIELAARLH